VFMMKTLSRLDFVFWIKFIFCVYAEGVIEVVVVWVSSLF